MKIDAVYAIIILLTVALVTIFTRSAPFMLFGGKKRLPPVLSYLGTVLPASIMAILVIYCLKNINFTSFPFGLAELISVAVVVIAHLIKKNTFISIIAGTTCYMILIRTVF